MFQIQREFDRVVADQQVTFLTVKLCWLELQPKLLELASAEGNDHLSSLMQTSTEELDEGQSMICALNMKDMLT